MISGDVRRTLPAARAGISGELQRIAKNHGVLDVLSPRVRSWQGAGGLFGRGGSLRADGFARPRPRPRRPGAPTGRRRTGLPGTGRRRRAPGLDHSARRSLAPAH